MVIYTLEEVDPIKVDEPDRRAAEWLACDFCFEHGYEDLWAGIPERVYYQLDSTDGDQELTICGNCVPKLLAGEFD